jgi:hypothetical protein
MDVYNKKQTDENESDTKINGVSKNESGKQNLPKGVNYI